MSIFSKLIRTHWDAVIASIAGCLFIYFFTRHSGIGISPDSVMYESAATNIRSHFSFTDFNGVALVDFPLAYPSLLAFLSFISGATVLHLLPLLNGFLFSGVIILTSVIIAGFKPTSSLYKTCFLALIACSPCLLEVYSMLWSETLFIFLILVFVIAMRGYFKDHSIRNLLVVALVAAIAFDTRYAGITVVGTGLFLLFFNGAVPLRKKFAHILLFITISCSLVIANLVRNSKVAGNVTGVREKALRTLSDNLQQIGDNLADWLPFLKGHESVTTLLFICILIAGLFILLFHCLQQQYFESNETIIACFFVVYSIFIITIATISRFENLTSRLLSPLYIPMLLVSSSWIIGVMKGSARFKRSVVFILIVIIYTGFQYNHYQQNAAAWEGIKDAGIPGYTEDSWTQCPAVAFIKKNKPYYTPPIFANANDAAYFLTGIHALPLPHKEIQQEINAFLQHSSFYLIWFNDGDNPDLISIDYIKQHKKQISVQQLQGGAVYFFADNTNNLAGK
jgi:hypothetical protein